MKKLIPFIEVIFIVLYFFFLDFFLSRIDYFEFLLGGIKDLKSLYVVFVFLCIPSLIRILVRRQKGNFLLWTLLFTLMAFIMWICSGWLYHTDYLSYVEMVRYVERTGYLPNITILGLVSYIFAFLTWLIPLLLRQGVNQWVQRHASYLYILCLSLCSLFFLVPSPLGRIGGEDISSYQIHNEDIYFKLERQNDSVLVNISSNKDFSQIESSLLLIPPKEHNLYFFDYYGNGYVNVQQYDSIKVLKGINCSPFYPSKEKYDIRVNISNLTLGVYKFDNQKYGERRVIPYHVSR